MRRCLLALLAATVALGSTAASASAQTLDITFRAALTKPAARSAAKPSSVPPSRCPATATARSAFTDETFEQISRSCAEYTGTTRIDFVDADIDPLVMSESGFVCFPGNSFNAPGAFHSYGNPFHQTGTFVVEDGPAELIDLTGTSDVRFAGAGLRGVYTMSSSSPPQRSGPLGLVRSRLCQWRARS